MNRNGWKDRKKKSESNWTSPGADLESFLAESFDIVAKVFL